MFKITAKEKQMILERRIKAKKLPDSEPLGIDVSSFGTNSLPRAETIGALTYVMPLFKKRGVTPIAGNRFKLGIKNKELYLIWTTKGKKTIRVRMEKNPSYYDDVVSVIKDAYTQYFKKLKQ